jgi:hypothetical protein
MSKKKTPAQKKADKAFIKKVSSLQINTGGAKQTAKIGEMPVTLTPPTPIAPGIGAGLALCEHGNPVAVVVGKIKKGEPAKHDDSGEMSVTE